MSRNQPVDPRVRLAISRWPDDAPRGAVTTFCAEHGITRKTFYALRARAAEEGPAAVLEPKSRRLRSSPTRVGDDVRAQAVQVRASLEQSGLDHGPISVHAKMTAMGLPAPSPATLARAFRDAGVARKEPKKRPRASFRRFVYPAPNACWQLDATEHVLTGGRKCVIFQLLDDHSRLAVASHVAAGETSVAAVEVVAKGIAAHGVPQRLLTDNGVALNPSRRGIVGQLVDYVTRLGVEPITGKPYKPTTQGKNERFHQTLFRFLDKQPLAATHAELQAQVDEFDGMYNTQRPHQGLPGHVTPQQAWDATPVAAPPRPITPASAAPSAIEMPGALLPENTRRVASSGGIKIGQVKFQIGSDLAGRLVAVVRDTSTISFYLVDTGELLIEHALPKPGTTYVSNGRPRGPRTRRHDEPSPKS
ncbi:integrase core domain-containing protein [Frondihabitans australicus]|uniref:Integrase-like protein n=1 Tax=Frondihabitans australicus TaxID=386892 RepID=A0A495II55_9MICO|nr:integrase-like protein [Frondihabitans australicus]